MQGAPAPHQTGPVFPGCHVGYSLLLEGASIRFGQQGWGLPLASALPRGLMSRNQTFPGQVLLAVNPHSC